MVYTFQNLIGVPPDKVNPGLIADLSRHVENAILGDVDGLVVIAILYPIKQLPQPPGNDFQPTSALGAVR